MQRMRCSGATGGGLGGGEGLHQARHQPREAAGLVVAGNDARHRRRRPRGGLSVRRARGQRCGKVRGGCGAEAEALRDQIRVIIPEVDWVPTWVQPAGGVTVMFGALLVK